MTFLSVEKNIAPSVTLTEEQCRNLQRYLTEIIGAFDERAMLSTPQGVV